MNIHNAVIQILKEVGRPLHAKEITKRIIKTGLWSSDGKTPEATVSAHLYSDIKKHGEQSAFVQVAPKIFSLRDAQLVTIGDAKKPAPMSKSPLASSKETHSFLDAAEKVLDHFGNRNSMHYRDITDKAMEQGWLITSGKTPEATMNAQLVIEFNRAKARGEPGRFIRTSPGHYGLVKWTQTGLSHQISQHNREIRKKLLSQLMDLSPVQFEGLVEQLLIEMGFENIDVTQSSNDNGIDVRGTLLIGGASRIKMAVQVKRLKKSIAPKIVREMRGSFGAHDQGLIITTSDFSTGAIEEANQPDKTPVGLMNGEQLVTLLMEYNIGVRRMSHDIFELEDFVIDKGNI